MTLTLFTSFNVINSFNVNYVNVNNVNVSISNIKNVNVNSSNMININKVNTPVIIKVKVGVDCADCCSTCLSFQFDVLTWMVNLFHLNL